MFATELKAELARLGLTQAEAAALLDVSPRAVWKLRVETLEIIFAHNQKPCRDFSVAHSDNFLPSSSAPLSPSVPCAGEWCGCGHVQSRPHRHLLDGQLFVFSVFIFSYFTWRYHDSTQFEPVFSRDNCNDNFRGKIGLIGTPHWGTKNRIAPRHCGAHQHAPAQIRIGDTEPIHPSLAGDCCNGLL